MAGPLAHQGETDPVERTDHDILRPAVEQLLQS